MTTAAAQSSRCRATKNMANMKQQTSNGMVDRSQEDADYVLHH
jgi:hypothetical protein